MTRSKRKARTVAEKYEVLGLDVSADVTEIREAYLRKVKENHPDRKQGIVETDSSDLICEHISKYVQCAHLLFIYVGRHCLVPKTGLVLV